VTEFVNADVIAQELGGRDTDRAAIAAGRVMLRRLRSLADARASFASETTLASRSFAPWLSQLRDTGYAAHLVFLWLPSVDLALARVVDRVRMGGHNVRPSTVRRRNRSGLRNFFDLYRPVVSTWRIYDASGLTPTLIADGDEERSARIYDTETWGVIGANFEEE